MARPVKLRSARPPLRNGLSRHFDGWPLALVVVAAAFLAALLTVPRRVIPADLPLPEVNIQARARQQRALMAQIRGAYSQQLPFEARAVGESLRRYGRVTALDQYPQQGALLAELRERTRQARLAGQDGALMQLRAVQTSLFHEALDRFEESGRQDDELRELGGTFLKRARERRWQQPGGHRLSLTREERTVLFQMRWTSLVGLMESYPFAPTREDWQVFYALELRYPGGESVPAMLASQLASIERLEMRDPSYPAALARGVVLYHLGKYPSSVGALQAHLAASPNGPWRLRAQNYLAESLAQQRERQAAESL